MAEDKALRVGVHRILQAGVLAGGALMAAGLARELAAGGGQSWISLGVLVLIATPALRVAYFAAACAKARDWPFFWVSLAVLALLSAGIWL